MYATSDLIAASACCAYMGASWGRATRRSQAEPAKAVFFVAAAASSSLGMTCPRMKFTIRFLCVMLASCPSSEIHLRLLWNKVPVHAAGPAAALPFALLYSSQGAPFVATMVIVESAVSSARFAAPSSVSSKASALIRQAGSGVNSSKVFHILVKGKSYRIDCRKPRGADASQRLPAADAAEQVLL